MLHALQKYESMTGVIERCNRTVLETLESGTLREAKIAAESFKNGGKRLRPALMILSSMAPTGKSVDEADDKLIDLAAAVELIHLATLFHDDVIDEVDNRRTNLNARIKYGNYVAVLAGDYVLAEALLLVNRSGLTQTMPEFLRTIRVLVRGESRETTHKFDFDITEAVYREIISEKSASLFSLACKVGAMSQDSEYVDVIGHFGWNLGMAFQMIDDLDDMIELPNGTMDCDLKNGYLALPVIRALGSLADGHRDKLVEIIRRGEFTPADEQQIVDACRDHGGIEYAHREIVAHLNQAGRTLERFDNTEACGYLEMIIRDLKDYTDAQLTSFVDFDAASA